MVRRNSYQKGCLFKRGRNWVARWREKVIEPDGSLGTRQLSVVLGRIAELSKSEARNLLTAQLQPLNQGRQRPQTTLTLAQFVQDYWQPAVKPFIRQTTLAVYQMHLRTHILPRFAKASLSESRQDGPSQQLPERLSVQTW